MELLSDYNALPGLVVNLLQACPVKKIFNLISAFLFPQKKKKKFVGKLQCGCDDIKIFLNDIIFGD